MLNIQSSSSLEGVYKGQSNFTTCLWICIWWSIGILQHHNSFTQNQNMHKYCRPPGVKYVEKLYSIQGFLHLQVHSSICHAVSLFKVVTYHSVWLNTCTWTDKQFYSSQQYATVEPPGRHFLNKLLCLCVLTQVEHDLNLQNCILKKKNKGCCSYSTIYVV